MDKQDALFSYTLRLGDNALILAQRLIEIVTHGPELEEEMANANFSLDYLGQARMFYSLAGKLEGAGRSEDDFAFLRDEREFCSFLLVEQPNGHFGDTIARSVLFDEFYQLQLDALAACAEPGVIATIMAAAASAQRAVPLRRSAGVLLDICSPSAALPCSGAGRRHPASTAVLARPQGGA